MKLEFSVLKQDSFFHVLLCAAVLISLLLKCKGYYVNRNKLFLILFLQSALIRYLGSNAFHHSFCLNHEVANFHFYLQELVYLHIFSSRTEPSLQPCLFLALICCAPFSINRKVSKRSLCNSNLYFIVYSIRTKRRLLTDTITKYQLNWCIVKGLFHPLYWHIFLGINASTGLQQFFSSNKSYLTNLEFILLKIHMIQRILQIRILKNWKV